MRREESERDHVEEKYKQKMLLVLKIIALA
jgi:hypothetical protein